MSKKVIINEEMMQMLVANQILEENGINKADIVNAVKDALKNDSSIKNDMEKKVRALVASSVNTLFRTLWQRRNFYEDEIKRG
jgi:hypothetical protein